jgi:DNA-binding beta-propeller fold protein YncE
MREDFTCPKGHEWEVSILGTHSPSGPWIFCPICGGRPKGAEGSTALTPHEAAARDNDPDARAGAGRDSSVLGMVAIIGGIALLLLLLLGFLGFFGFLTMSRQGLRAEMAMRDAEMARMEAESRAAEQEAEQQVGKAEQKQLAELLKVMGNDLKTARDEAEAQRRAAEEALQRVEQQLYVLRVNQAAQAWSAKNLDQAREQLKESPARLRGWEWHLLQRLSQAAPRVLQGHTAEITGVAFSPDGKTLATGSEDKTAKLWDATTGKEVLTFREHMGSVRTIAFSPNGRRVASAGTDGSVRVWNSKDGQELLDLEVPGIGVSNVAFSPDSQRLAAAGQRLIQVWDVVKGQENASFKPDFRDMVAAIAFSPDGKHLAAAGLPPDNKVKVWDLSAGQEVADLAGLDGARAVAFSPDGKQLAAADGGTNVKVWALATGKLLFTLKGHTNQVRCLTFHPDGKTLVSAGLDGTVRVWGTATGQELLSLVAHPGGVSGLSFTGDGQQLATCGGEKNKPGEVKIWDARALPADAPPK